METPDVDDFRENPEYIGPCRIGFWKALGNNLLGLLFDEHSWDYRWSLLDRQELRAATEYARRLSRKWGARPDRFERVERALGRYWMWLYIKQKMGLSRRWTRAPPPELEQWIQDNEFSTYDDVIFDFK